MKSIITTSWDDGDALDKRLSELLARYGIKGTFYVTKEYRPERLTELEIKDLSDNHEVGAHTLTHPDLLKLSREEALREMTGSKTWLEEVIGKEVRMFCYPSGKYSPELAALAKEAGFQGARTTERYVRGLEDPFRMGTTMNVYPFPFRKRDENRYFFRYLFQPLIEQYKGLQSIGVPLMSLTSWSSAAKAAFDATLKNGGTFHLWGHSWEIEKYGMWEELEEVLKYMSGREDCAYLTNAEALRHS